MTKTLPKANNRNSETINGQLWHFKAVRYWSPDTAGGSYSRCYTATRYSDGRTVTRGTRERLVQVIAERIANGTY